MGEGDERRSMRLATQRQQAHGVQQADAGPGMEEASSQSQSQSHVCRGKSKSKPSKTSRSQADASRTGKDYTSLVFDWQFDSVKAFVKAANATDVPESLPTWLQSPPPMMSSSSFLDDVVTYLCGDLQRAGNVLISPTTKAEYNAVIARLMVLQTSDFVQTVANVALQPTSDEKRFLAQTANLVYQPGGHVPVQNSLPHPTVEQGSTMLKPLHLFL